MRLYFNRATRATRPRWVLEEIGVPYELVTVDLQKGEHRTEAYLRVHPLGKLPAMEFGDDALFESAALCLQLADRFPEAGLAPPVGTPERGQYYQWAIYSVATLETPLPDYAAEARKPETQRDPEKMDTLAATFRRYAAPLETLLQTREFLVGDRFGVADVLIASVLRWARGLGLLADLPALTAYVDRMTARPAYRRAIAP